jgi:hypothetical protein
MRARIRLFGLIDQNASESWLDTCGWLISIPSGITTGAQVGRNDRS